ncbi:MAG: MopE-related protein [Pseudomonadota bacterium]
MFLALLLAPLAGALPPAIPDTDAHATWYGESAGDYAGRTISGNADTDGDGYPDLLVGAYGSDDGGTSSGEAYLLLGGATRWSGSLGLASAAASWVGDTGEYVSLELALVPDLDGDGLDDIAIATYSNSQVAAEAGKLYLVYGGGPLGGDQDLGAVADAAWLGEEAYDHAGRSVAGLGDVDGDGYGDLMVAGCWNSGSGAYQAGRAYLLLGGPARWSGDASLAGADASFDGEAAGDYAGRNVAATGDVDGDGLSDMLIGAYCADTPGGTDAGEAYLVLGKRSGWSLDTPLGTGADASFQGENADDRAALVVAGAGDVDADGYQDMLVAAYRHDGGGSDAGAVYLVRGAASGWALDVSLAAADALYVGEDALDYAGRSAGGVGDVDQDGFDDLLIGATDADDGGSNAGRAYLVLGSAAPSDRDLSAADTIITGSNADADFPYVLCWAGDLDGGGSPDLVLPAYHDSSVASSGGLLRVVYTDDWLDRDGDGYSAPDGDCDDGDASVYPGAPEIPCDGVDQDCDGADLLDADGDGYDSDAFGGTDCDDSDPAVHPGAVELCLDGVDNDCDGFVDWADANGDGIDDCAFECPEGIEDADQDDDGAVRAECGGNDCDDLDPEAFPGAEEVPYDGVDQDCSGEDLTDVDGDGCDGGAAGDDCDDADGAVHPGAEEVPYNGVDDDCSGGDLTDVDGDGHDGEPAGGDDCDDEEPDVNPDAEEICDDGIDNDCDDVVDDEDPDCGAGGDTGGECVDPDDTGEVDSAPEDTGSETVDPVKGCGGCAGLGGRGLSLGLLVLGMGVRRRRVR